MSDDKGTKVNQLLKSWPSGTVALSNWLRAEGVRHNLASRYEKSHWIERIWEGAFIKSGDQVGWQGGVYALQQHAKLPAHVGGLTALELQGRGHFVPGGGGRAVYLFGPPRLRLPVWFKKHPWADHPKYVGARLFKGTKDLGLTELKVGSFAIRISSRERALFEVLHLVPEEQSYEEAKLLMDSLSTIRPSLVQTLLQQCQSIKVKRLFLHLAESSQHAWFADLKTNRLKLGKGKRKIGSGGVYDSKYKISVPKIQSGSPSEKDAP